MARGERYALVPVEVMTSPAYVAQPDFAKVVLFAIAAGYHGRNNGDISLTIKDAKALGVAHSWKLYAGLNLLKRADLIECTRQGRLERGTKLCSLYAVTWKGIDKPPEKVAYDAAVIVSPFPSNRWAKWERPADWLATVRDVSRANHGRRTNPVSTTVGKGRSTTVGAEVSFSDQPRWGKETSFSAPPVVDASKKSPGVPTTDHGDDGLDRATTTASEQVSPSKSKTAKFQKRKSAGNAPPNDGEPQPCGVSITHFDAA